MRVYGIVKLHSACGLTRSLLACLLCDRHAAAALKFGRGNKSIVGMTSSEGEGFAFRSMVPMEGAVEVWMTGVEAEMRRTLAVVMKEGEQCKQAAREGSIGAMQQQQCSDSGFGAGLDLCQQHLPCGQLASVIRPFVLPLVTEIWLIRRWLLVHASLTITMSPSLLACRRVELRAYTT
jgi:hypothetical protein